MLVVKENTFLQKISVLVHLIINLFQKCNLELENYEVYLLYFCLLYLDILQLLKLEGMYRYLQVYIIFYVYFLRNLL